MENYFTWDRIFLTGTMNGSDVSPVTTFDSEIRKELQIEIEFPLCCDEDFNPLDFIVTEMGSGQVEVAVISSLRNSMSVELKY